MRPLSLPLASAAIAATVTCINAWAVVTASVAPASFRSIANGADGPLAASQGKLAADVMAEDLRQPWGFDFLPDGRVLVTEKAGRMRLFEPGERNAAPMRAGPSLGGVPDVADRGQGGLLDVAVSPQFASDRTIYFTFAEPADDGARTTLASAILGAEGLSDVRVLFRQTPALRTSRHFGSRIVFTADGHLLLGLGDRGQESYAQEMDNTVGKVVRIRRDDGAPPPDNPFAGQRGVDPTIYSFGHRNIQGAFLHPQTQRLWVIEHGPQGGDELNEVQPAGNHGWPRITHGVQYGSGARIGEGETAPGIVPAKVWWTPVSIAPSGLALYTGQAVPALRNHVLAGSLSASALIALQLKDDRPVSETRYVTDGQESIRQIRNGPDGHPWLLTAEGRLLRVVQR